MECWTCVETSEVKDISHVAFQISGAPGTNQSSDYSGTHQSENETNMNRFIGWPVKTSVICGYETIY